MEADSQFTSEATKQPEVGPNDVALSTPADLARIVETTAASGSWIGRVRLCSDRRWYERIYHGPDHDLWVISWLPGQSTGFHDHGTSSGAFVVATGELEELRRDGHRYLIKRGKACSFGPDFAHDVRNVSDAPAISIHAYSPPLSEMNEYEFDRGRLVPRSATIWRSDTIKRKLRTDQAQDKVSRVEQMLVTARTRLRRMSPNEALDAVVRANAVLVDIRPASQRAVEGTIPGAILVERNVLEWRFDPRSGAQLPIATDHELQVIIFCSEGYASSLAAAALQDLGLWRATDVAGGFHAWRAAGLPIIREIVGEDLQGLEA